MLVGAVGEVGGVGEDVGVGLVLEAELAQVLEAVSRGADFGQVADEGLQLRFGLGEEGQFVRATRLQPGATFFFHSDYKYSQNIEQTNQSSTKEYRNATTINNMN